MRIAVRLRSEQAESESSPIAVAISGMWIKEGQSNESFDDMLVDIAVDTIVVIRGLQFKPRFLAASDREHV